MAQSYQQQRLTNYSTPAIAPPPPVPPPTPAPQFAAPPVAADNDLDESNELLSMIREPQPLANTQSSQQTQTPSTQQGTVSGNTSPNNPALNPNPIVPPPAPVQQSSTPQLNQYGTYATPEQIAETLAAGETPFNMNGYTPPPAVGVGGATGGMSAPVSYIGNTGQIIGQDGSLGAAQWGPGGAPLPYDGIEITPESIEANRAYWIGVNAQNQGGPATQAQIDAAPFTPPGTTFPNIGNPAIEAPWMGGPEQQYGPGTAINGVTLPDSYGYIGSDDPYNDTDAELLSMLDGGMGGYGGTDIVPGPPPRPTSTPLTTGTQTQNTPVVPPVSPVVNTQPEVQQAQPGSVDVDTEVDEELRNMIRERAGDTPELGGGESDDLMSLFDEGANALKARTERNRKEGQQAIAERMSARGTVGGSPEFSELGDLEERLFLAEQEGLSELNRERYGFGLQARAQDLQKYGIDANLAYNYAALEQDAGFRTTAQELQATGMQLDEAYRYAAMAQDSTFRKAALDLQAHGMKMDDAYRYAALNQDSRFRQIASDLQKRGLDIQEAYQQAALAWDKERFGQQLAFEREGLDLEKQRLRAQIMAGLLAGDIDLGDLSDEEKAALGIPAGTNTKGLTPEQEKALKDKIRQIFNSDGKTVTGKATPR